MMAGHDARFFGRDACTNNSKDDVLGKTKWDRGNEMGSWMNECTPATQTM